jgi:hypothetical protein
LIRFRKFDFARNPPRRDAFSFRWRSRCFRERDALGLGAHRRQHGDDDRDCACDNGEREAVIARERRGDAGLQCGVDGGQQIAELVDKPGNVARAVSGDNSLRCTGTMPQAPWTKNCIRNAPAASKAGLAENAQSGITGRLSSAAMTMHLRRPKRSDSDPKKIPPQIMPIL